MKLIYLALIGSRFCIVTLGILGMLFGCSKTTDG